MATPSSSSASPLPLPAGLTLSIQMSNLEVQLHRNSSLVPEIRWWVQRMTRILLNEGYTTLMHSPQLPFTTKSVLSLPPPLSSGDKLFLDAKFHVALFLRRGDLVLPLVKPDATAPPGSGVVPLQHVWAYICEDASFQLLRDVFLNVSAPLRREWVVSIYSLGAPDDFRSLVQRLRALGVPDVRLELDTMGTDVIARMAASSLVFTAGSTLSMSMAWFDSSSVKLQPAGAYYGDDRYYGVRAVWSLPLLFHAQPEVGVLAGSMASLLAHYARNETVWWFDGAGEAFNGTKAKQREAVTMPGVRSTAFRQSFQFTAQAEDTERLLRRIERAHAAKVRRLQHRDQPNFLENYADDFDPQFILNFNTSYTKQQWFPRLWNKYRTDVLLAKPTVAATPA